MKKPTTAESELICFLLDMLEVFFSPCREISAMSQLEVSLFNCHLRILLPHLAAFVD